MENNLTKHEQLKNWIVENIRNGTFKAGERMVSENELCAMFHVSRHTVRHALDTLETEGLLDRRRGSGTYILYKAHAAHLQTKNVGVILSYLDDYIFPSIVKGIDGVLTAAGYNIILGITYNKLENEKRLLSACMEKDVDGVIVEATKSALPNPNLSLYGQLAAKGVPMVFVNCYYRGLDSSYVIMNDARSGYLAAEELIAAGHERIGGIFKLDDMQGQERYAGFLTAMRDRNLPINENNVVWYSTEDIGGLLSGESDQFLLHRLEGCTGVVCYNDQVAVGLIEVCARNGVSVPDDLSITSFDNSSLAQMGRVRLTTVSHPGEKLGQKAAEGLCTLMNGRQDRCSYIFEPELIRRESVKSLNKYY